MTKQEVLRQVQELQLPKEKYVVLMGASLCAHGIREAGDIDLLIHGSMKDVFIARGFKEEVLYSNGVCCRRFSKGCIEVFDYFLNVGFFENFSDECSSIDFIEGVPFVTLKDALTIKERFGREKDIRDAGLIRSYLSLCHSSYQQ